MLDVGRQHVHLDPALGHPLRGHRLDAEVERGDGEPLVPQRFHDVRLASVETSSASCGAGHLRRRPDDGQQLVRAAVGGRPGEDADPHGAALAQVPGQRPGVDAADPDDALGGQLVVERAARAPATTAAGEGSRTT